MRRNGSVRLHLVLLHICMVINAHNLVMKGSGSGDGGYHSASLPIPSLALRSLASKHLWPVGASERGCLGRRCNKLGRRLKADCLFSHSNLCPSTWGCAGICCIRSWQLIHKNWGEQIRDKRRSEALVLLQWRQLPKREISTLQCENDKKQRVNEDRSSDFHNLKYKSFPDTPPSSPLPPPPQGTGKAQ